MASCGGGGGARLVAPVQAIVLSPDPDEEDALAGGAELWRQARRVRLGSRLLPSRLARRPPSSPPPRQLRRSASSDHSDGSSTGRRSSCDITLWSDAELMAPPGQTSARRQRLRPTTASFRRLRETATSVFGAVKFRAESADGSGERLGVPADQSRMRSRSYMDGEGESWGVEGESSERERGESDPEELLTMYDSGGDVSQGGVRQKDHLRRPPLNKRMSELARRSADRILQSGKQEQQIMERFVLRESSQERLKRARARALRPPPSLSGSSNASSVTSRGSDMRTISVRIVKEILPPGANKYPQMAGQAPRVGTIALENAKKAASLFITVPSAQSAVKPPEAPGSGPETNDPAPQTTELSATQAPEAPAVDAADTTTSAAAPEVSPPSAVGWTPSRRSSVASVTSQVSLTPAQRRAFLKKLRLRRNVQVPGVMYTDQARAAAVALGEHDIKYSLKNRRFLNRGHGSCWVSDDSTFAAFASHAQLELRRGDPTYAIQLFDRALEFEPKDESCLASRAKCNLLLGNNEAALKDAELILRQNPRCARALSQKAEALYALGEFEMALVYFSRGLRLRPDMAVFPLGVDTATEAIENAIGERASLIFSGVEPLLEGLKLSPDLTEEAAPTPSPPPASKPGSAGGLSRGASRDTAGSGRGRGRGRGRAGSDRAARTAPNCRPVLEELAVDKEYMERLIQHPALSGQCRTEVVKHAEQAITFLEKRQQFWAKQKPVYTRQMERRRALGLLGPTSGGGRGKRGTSSARPLGGRVGSCIDVARSARSSDRAGAVDSARSTERVSDGGGGSSSPSATDRSSSDRGGASSVGSTNGTSSGVGSATSAADLG
ncbi:uncharacterized protein LOC122384301 [Amphibalanus amphitrite]|uniref:uncharacterized protein LOC122384301 n=1 Tax=Amphibalanus amphitrite TaxID=1232801 RepID=UPI001C918258|nr:uncharacterized protein LOC122384301 [Amphibalanus amphitrite]